MRLLLLEWKPYLWLACGLWPVGIGVIETFFPAGENGETLFLQSEKLQRQIEFGGHAPLPTIVIGLSMILNSLLHCQNMPLKILTLVKIK